MSHFFNNLIALAAQNGLSIRAVSEGAGLPPSTLSRYVRRGSSASVRNSTILAVARFFNVDPIAMASTDLLPPVDEVTMARVAPSADLDASEPTPPKQTHIIPLVSQAVASDLAKLSDIPLADKVSPYPYETVPPPAFPELYADDKIFAFRVRGGAMTPAIPDGAIVYFRKIESEEQLPAGAIVLATTRTVGTEIFEELDDCPFVTVRLYSTDEFGRIWLTATNPTLPPDVKVIQGREVIGHVVAWCVRAP